MQQTDIFNIRTQSVIDTILPENAFGNIFILGQRSALSEKIAELCSNLIDNLDPTATFYHYKLRALETQNEDHNIICPIQDPANHRVFYIVAQAESDELDLAVPAVINEAESQMRKFAEEAIIMAAMEDPELFKAVVDKVIFEGHGGDNSNDGISPLSMEPRGAAAGALIWMPLTPFYTIFDRDSCESAAIETEADMDDIEPNMHEAALGIVKGAPRPKFSTISAKQKKEAFSKLPGRLNKAFEQQNPMDCEIVRQTMETYSATEVYAILMELARTKPHLLRDFHSTAINSASRYEIHVRPWKSTYRNDFKDRYLYCIYLKNAKGKKCAVTFKNYPAYCIYMMYIIDHVQRGDEVTELVLKDLRQEFCGLYKTILCETERNIKNFYEGMDYRTIAETGKIRKGRYDDYIKDIHETLERLVGEIDSIPLKVGHGRYLGVLPERIFIDEKLSKFKFA